MKPSLTPYFLRNSSPWRLRSSITGAILTSLKVVSIAVSVFAWTRRSAILRRSGDMRLRVVRPSREGMETGAAGADGATAVGATDEVAGATPRIGAWPARAASMSPLVTRPALPEPSTPAGSSPVSAERRRTAGETSAAAPDLAATGGALGAGAAATGAALAVGAEAVAGAEGALPAAPASIEATT